MLSRTILSHGGWRVLVLAAALGALGGCEIFGLGDGGADSGGGDLAMGPPDLNKEFVVVNWTLLNANLIGTPGNGFQVKCDDANVGVTELQITATNGQNKSAMTRTPCPAGTADGEVFIAVPDPSGPWTVSATAVGKPKSASEKIKDVMPGGIITVRLYVDGCDAQSCL